MFFGFHALLQPLTLSGYFVIHSHLWVPESHPNLAMCCFRLPRLIIHYPKAAQVLCGPGVVPSLMQMPWVLQGIENTIQYELTPPRFCCQMLWRWIWTPSLLQLI